MTLIHKVKVALTSLGLAQDVSILNQPPNLGEGIVKILQTNFSLQETIRETKLVYFNTAKDFTTMEHSH